MATETLDFTELNSTSISTNFDVGTYDLEPFFIPYHLYVEERISGDTPKDSKTNLYNLYDAGINNLEEEDWKITVSEEISSFTQIYCTNNYRTITSNFYSTTGNFSTIHYDSLISELSGLDSLTSFADMSADVMQWINEYVNDFGINQNPENSDDSNLILTQALKADIQTITENILNKVFRNLVQLIRFKRDYRMYGPYATIYGNCYNTDTECQNHTAVPASCFTERGNHYMIGKKAYEDNIASVGGTISNSVWHINPHTSYAIDKHTHTVSVGIGHLPTTISGAHNVLVSMISAPIRHEAHCKYTNDAEGNGTSWEKQMDHIDGVVDWKNETSSSTSNHVEYSGSYRYSWNSSSSHCRLVSKSAWTDNPWSNVDIKLPTYSTRVWVWSNSETSSGTNITSPMQYITST